MAVVEWFMLKWNYKTNSISYRIVDDYSWKKWISFSRSLRKLDSTHTHFLGTNISLTASHSAELIISPDQPKHKEIYIFLSRYVRTNLLKIPVEQIRLDEIFIALLMSRSAEWHVSQSWAFKTRVCVMLDRKDVTLWGLERRDDCETGFLNWNLDELRRRQRTHLCQIKLYIHSVKRYQQRRNMQGT